MFGLDVLMTSCLLPALRRASRRQWWKTLLLGGALLAFPVVFYERVYTIVYVDMLLALLTAYLIFTAPAHRPAGSGRPDQPVPWCGYPDAG